MKTIAEKLVKLRATLEEYNESKDLYIRALGWDKFSKSTERLEIYEKIRNVEKLINELAPQEIKKYCNQHFYTDVEAYEVVKVISEQTIELRPMIAKQISAPKEFHAGGFCGHYSDNRSGQDYEYTSNPDAETFRVRYSKRNRQWQIGKYNRFVMSDAPYKFHDYNF